MRFNERLLLEQGFNKADVATLRDMLGNSNAQGTLASQDADDVDIDGGVIDNVIIGGATASTATFTTVTVTTIDGTTATFTTLAGTLSTEDQPNITSLGVLISLVATSVDINGGAIDATAIGLTSQSTGAFTSLSNSGLHTRSVSDGITAFATGGQANAVVLTADINEISVVGTGGDSSKLPTAAAGYYITIINNGANAMDVFPNTGDDLGAGVDTAVSLAAGSNITYASYDATNWESV